MSTTVTTQKAAPPPVVTLSPVAAEFKRSLESYSTELQKLLPKNIALDAFKRIVFTAVQDNTDLLMADRATLFRACLSAAKDGLLPDGRQAVFVVYGTKKKDGTWTQKVSYQQMVAGIILKARTCPERILITAHVVYHNDAWDYELGDCERIFHKPTLIDRGAPIGAYAIARFGDGTVVREVMSIADIEKIRASSRAAQGVFWTKWWDEMARKTVIHRLAKSLPIDTPITIDDDDEPIEKPVESVPPVAKPAPATVVDVTPPAPVAEAVQVVEPAPKPEATTTIVHPETGEIIDVTPVDSPVSSKNSFPFDSPFDAPF